VVLRGEWTTDGPPRAATPTAAPHALELRQRHAGAVGVFTAQHVVGKLRVAVRAVVPHAPWMTRAAPTAAAPPRDKKAAACMAP
jgi:hypothetical protein